MTTSLYRLYDDDEELLYVGITNALPTRLEQHRASKPWWTEVKTIQVRHYDTREDAESSERWFIKKERPRWNVAHSLGHLSWSDIKAEYPRIRCLEREARAVGPGCCADLWQDLAHKCGLRDLPEEVQAVATCRIVPLIKCWDCE